ncbi:metalloendoproteinase 2-MMP-like [Prosopis cineraria]|uniref:metalloendoproteinase 2-MMP-like n=1 Tax=Prosopis cineraria TaxID=364024 RepID=UPI00240EC776|nr:metalloendoproteinase 2-MMP-like [Prosopis cineraria]
MRVRKAYILVLILSILVVDESSPFLLRPASANALFNIPLWFRIFRTLKNLNFSFISKALDKLRSFRRAHNGRLRIGDVVDGISKLYDYFKLFGYINSTLNSDNTGKFSAELESAIEYFQKTFHLNVTGQPDDPTVSLITLPRCGIPDVINGSSTLLGNRTTSFKKWLPEGKKELTYSFSPENETTTSLKDVFSDAFRRWSNVAKMNFTQTTSFNEADIKIMFASLDEELGVVGGSWLDDTAKSWDVVLDSDEKWVLLSEDTTESDELDLESAVMHQIGHVLGLSHSAIEEAVMYPFVLPSKKRKVDFAQDDLERIQQLYGTKSDSPKLSQTQSPQPGGGGVGGVGPCWSLISTLFLGINSLFWF